MKRLWPVLVIMAVVALYASFVNNKLKFGSDSVDYYRLAQSICAGEGYTIEGRFVSKWPPVTPTLLAVGLGVFGNEIAGQKILLGAVALLGLVVAYRLLGQRGNSRLSALAVILTAVSFPFIYWVMDLSSEGAYFLFTMLALWLGQRAFAEPPKVRWAILTGLCMGLAILSRTVGISLLAGFGLFAVINLIRHRQAALRPTLLALIPALIIAGGWFWYGKMQGGEGSVAAYSKYGFRPDIYDPTGKAGLKTSLAQITQNVKGYAFIFSIPDASVRMKKMNRLNAKGLLSLAIMSLAVIGYAYHLYRRTDLAECYLLAYAGILLLFNWYDIRYVVPVLPLLFYYLGWTINRLGERLTGPQWRPRFGTAILVLLILANTGISVASQPAKKLRSPDYHGPAGELHEAALWIKANDPNAVVMCRWANMTWFWTRLKVVGVPILADPEAMWQHMQDNQVSIVIADPDEFSGVTGKYLEPALTAHPDQVTLLQTFGQTRVFRIQP
jgi:4-amino-4-deoxy-L-arabinose transferase-like glycosyltransferase